MSLSFRDIKPYTRWGNYQVNVSLGFLEKWIEEQLCETPPLIMEPDFQRGHVWSEVQQSRFIEHLLREGRSGRDILCNCPGWQMGKLTGPYELVDGLQRLTACLRFLRNEIPAFGHLRREYTGTLRCLGGEAGLMWHVNSLETRAEVLQWYLDLNSGGVVHTEAELNRVRKLLDKEQQKEKR